MARREERAYRAYVSDEQRSQAGCIGVQSGTFIRGRALTARGKSLAAFDGRCILAGCVAPSSNIPDILGRRALPARRLTRLGATPDFHHGLLSDEQRREAGCPARKMTTNFGDGTLARGRKHQRPELLVTGGARRVEWFDERCQRLHVLRLGRLVGGSA